MARIIARRIALDPDMIEHARAQLGELGLGSLSSVPVRAWAEALGKDPVSLRRFMTARGDHMDWVRKWSPFAFVPGTEALEDVPTRRRIWRACKRVAITRAKRVAEVDARAVPGI